jgi:hypothetical protein
MSELDLARAFTPETNLVSKDSSRCKGELGPEGKFLQAKELTTLALSADVLGRPNPAPGQDSMARSPDSKS